MAQPPQFYHYTCRCAAKQIGRYGLLVPHDQPMLGGARLIWFTDQAQPDRLAVGLTSTILRCDRMERRYLPVEDRNFDFKIQIVPWLESPYRTGAGAAALELAPGAIPSHWFVSALPVSVRMDLQWTRRSA